MGQVSPQQMVEAGVDAVSHATLLLRALGSEGYAALMKDSTGAARGRFDLPVFDSLFAEMRRRGTLFEPTLFVYRGDRKNTFPYAAEITRRASELGMPIVAGTDSVGRGDEGAWQLPNLHEELRLLVKEAGLTTDRALAAATRNAARALGVLTDHGTVERDKLADLVILDADPLADIGNTAAIHLVVKRGAVYPGGPTLAR